MEVRKGKDPMPNGRTKNVATIRARWDFMALYKARSAPKLIEL